MLTVGIVANEFYDTGLGRMGGFGMNALLAARALSTTADPAVRPIFLSGEHRAAPTRPWRPAPRLVGTSNGFPILLRGRRARWLRRLRELDVDVLLTIEHRPTYDVLIDALPTTPLVVWVRDPRPRADLEKIGSLAIPGEAAAPLGVEPNDSSSFGPIWRRARDQGRPLAAVSPAPGHLNVKAREAYGIPDFDLGFLGNALTPVATRPRRSARPSVLFIGRLDPIKRPWLFAELAARFPQVDFLVLGQPHFTGPGAGTAWLTKAPANLHVLAHVDGPRKADLFAGAWVLVNTSIHEALPTSFLEALHYGVPLLSCHDPEEVASRFGVYVGRWDGDGMAALPAFADGLERLLEDAEMRERLGETGRDWVREHHTRDRFLADFKALAGRLLD